MNPKCLLPCILFAFTLSFAEPVPVPDGYRMTHYRAPTPDTLPGARRIDAQALAQWLASASPPVLLDVMPANRVRNLDGESVWLPAKARRHIENSIWLPNVGQGAPDSETLLWFERELARLSHGDKSRSLVFYCLRDCWMSWNAGRRALALGYRNVAWFAEGSDGWLEAGLPLVDGKPLSMP